jgi:hypothetical protein
MNPQSSLIVLYVLGKLGFSPVLSGYLFPSPEDYKIQKKELENDFECKNKC